MSPCYTNSNMAICTGSNTQYRARTRQTGFQKYRRVGKLTRSYRIAVMRMAKAFAEDRNVKRADVLMIADYYDPVQICELVRT